MADTDDDATAAASGPSSTEPAGSGLATAGRWDDDWGPAPEPEVAPGPTPARRPRRRRERFRTRRTALWTISKMLLFAAFVGLAAATYIAVQPVNNPGVQDCGSSLGFFLQGKHDVIIHPGEPDAPPDAVALASQPSCRDLASLELQKASVGLVAFFVFGLLGILLGLLDDRIEYWKAPNYETLLRPMPREARIRYGLVPKVAVDDLGAELPPLETPELWGIAIIGALTFVLLPLAGPLSATRDAWSSAQILPLLLGVVASALVFVAAAVQRRAVYPSSDGWSRVGELVLAAAFSGRLRPVVGSFGIDIHHLRKTGLTRDEAKLDVQVLETVSLVCHAVLLGFGALVFQARPFSLGALAESVMARNVTPQFWLGLGLLVFVLSSLQRLVRRIRALAVHPGWAGLRGLPRVAGDPQQVAMLVGGTIAVSVMNALVLLASLSVFGASVTFGQALFVTLAAITVGSMVTSPNGLGGFEAAMALALMAAGIDPGVAIATTLTYRVLTFWLPMLPGWRASRSLHRDGAL